jgi:hypothetical protein
MTIESLLRLVVMDGLGKSTGCLSFVNTRCARCTWPLVVLFRPMWLTTSCPTKATRCFSGTQRIIRPFANTATTVTNKGLRSQVCWLAAMKVVCRLILATIGTRHRQGGRVQSLKLSSCRPIPNLPFHNREMNRGYPLLTGEGNGR